MNNNRKATVWGMALSVAVMAWQPAHAMDYLGAGSETQGDVVFFTGSFYPLVSYDKPETDRGPGTKAGWHLPGRSYRSASGWWALVCNAGEKQTSRHKSCKLYDTRLTVTPARHGVYDSEPVKSQLLYWSPLPFKLDKMPQEDEKRPDLIAVFKPVRSLANLTLSAGPLTTYLHRGMGSYPTAQRPGTLEVRIATGKGLPLDIVPRVLSATSSSEESKVKPGDIATVELRMGKLRQRLPGYIFSALDSTGQLHQTDYLLWAGDLDGDGRADLILNHSEEPVHAALYLSSLAKEGELVGLAGSLQYTDPSSAGC